MTSVRRLVACLSITAFAMTFSTYAADDKDKKTPTTKEIMKKVPGKNGLVAKTSTAAKDGNWDEAQKDGKELKTYSEALSKNVAKKGDKESWEKHTKGFSEIVTEIADGADKKDNAAVQAGVKKFGATCKGCHDAHK
ncbi:cytochrome c [Limnoglobus roseus]|uniref:Cytochrome C n=1 Tax=Limnoglobus roseus TaxID=2598579 RepID=A0A5C1AFC6_9BACT|nr:cytochrome c [Limnoglobus roseus]QEL18119.1 hypothetical protein PX52LOC_05133 [Limnoglobus roseus]